MLLTLVAVEHLALSRLLKAREDASPIGSARPGLLVAALALEVGVPVQDGVLVFPGRQQPAFVAAVLLAMLPTTPGGPRVVEGILVPALVTLGASTSVALLGVITWRLVQFWLPMPLALEMYASLWLGREAPPSGGVVPRVIGPVETCPRPLPS